MPRISKTQRATRYETLQRGVRKRWRDGLTLGDRSYTQAHLVRGLQAVIDAFAAADRARAAYRKAIAIRGRVEREHAPMVEDVITGAYLRHGAFVDAMADFDLPMERPKGPRTAEAKARMVRNRKKRKSG
jgi:hypothetical protein